ncbi:YhfG family protein [Halomonas sp. A29]|uniref:YhfG family protein n=1 Tax=Halomonas sp. A29 TaxID=3102786 RepID=UPI00398B2105
MIKVPLKTKQDYFAKVRLHNYAASLRLEGFSAPDAPHSLPSKSATLEKYRQR